MARKLTQEEKATLKEHKEKYGTKHARKMLAFMTFKDMSLDEAHKETLKRMELISEKHLNAETRGETGMEQEQEQPTEKPVKKSRKKKEIHLTPVEEKPKLKSKEPSKQFNPLEVMKDEKINKLAQKLIKRLAREENSKIYK